MSAAALGPAGQRCADAGLRAEAESSRNPWASLAFTQSILVPGSFQVQLGRVLESPGALRGRAWFCGHRLLPNWKGGRRAAFPCVFTPSGRHHLGPHTGPTRWKLLFPRVKESEGPVHTCVHTHLLIQQIL